MATESLFFVLKPWAVPLRESGERHLWAAVNEKYGKEGKILVGSDSELTTSTLVQNMWDDGTEKKVWEHTEEVFDKICKQGGTY
jgi:hypothetical protein